MSARPYEVVFYRSVRNECFAEDFLNGLLPKIRGKEIMKGVRRFRDYVHEQLRDPAIRKAYKEAGLFVELAIQIARLREQQGLSQRDLAHRLHTSQQMISRLESPHNGSLSLRTLVKLAHTLGKEVKVQFV